jgi:acetyl esterase
MISPKVAPEIRTVLEFIAAQGGPPMETLPPTEARRVAYGFTQLAGEPEPVARIENRRIPGRAGEIPIRIYTPEGDGPFPGALYFHGGGWMICDLETHDNICRSIAKRAGAVVVAVDYRLAPEHKFPAALQDCEDATRWVADNAASLRIDPRRLAVTGDSAGANMATVIAAKSRDAKGPAIALQVLVYPVTDLTSQETVSHKEFGEDHFLTGSVMKWFLANFLAKPEDARNPDVSPAFIANHRGMPPALVITAECDPLRDEGEAYAKRLQDSGISVVLTRYDGMIHPFLNMLGVSQGAQKAIDQIAAAIRNMVPAKTTTG